MRYKLIQVQEHKMYVDPIDKGDVTTALIKKGIFHPVMTKTVRELVKPGMVVIDAGAHVGYFTLIMAKYVGKSGLVYAFEPEPNNFRLLTKNVSLNKYQNIKLLQLAVTDANGKGTLYVSTISQGSHSLACSNIKRARVRVKLVSLDSFFSNHKGFDFIKVDVEGAEYGVLRSMHDIVRKNPNILMIYEFGQHLLQGFGVKPIELLNLLTNYGFKIYNINEKTQRVGPVSIPILMQRYPPGKATNILARRK